MTWWNRLLRRNQMDEDLDKELRFHVDQYTDDLVANGHAPQQARRLARLALGGPEQLKEDCRDARGTRWIEDLWQDFRYALRTLRQRPGFAGVALLTLALGTGATTVMFTVINSVLLKPLAYPHPDRLITLHSKTEKYGDDWGFSYPDFLDFAGGARTLEHIAAWSYNGGGTVSEPGEPAYVEGREISSDLFSVLGVFPERGRAFQPDEDQPRGAPVAIISYGLWQRRFAGSPMAVGQRLVLDGKPRTIVGIAPAGFQLYGNEDVFTPLGQDPTPRLNRRDASFLRVVARLRPGATLSQAQTEMSRIGSNLAIEYPESNKGRAFAVHALREEFVGDVRSTLWLLLGAVGLVLLMACVNVASLLLARAVSRERELAMRMALGAGRARLIRQCLTESALLGLCGGALGILLAGVGLRPFVLFWPDGLPRAEEVGLDWHVLLCASAVSLVSGLFFGLAPALRAPSRELEQTIRARARSVTGRSHRLHSSFVGAQIALAIVLLVSAGLLARTLLRISSLDPGLNVHDVLAARAAISPGALSDPARMRAAWQDFLDRARSVPGIHSAALADIVPMRTGMNTLAWWTTPALPGLNQMPVTLATCATPDYLTVMGIPLRRGRFFDNHDRLGSEPVVVIDEVMAQHAFKGEDPIGKRLWIPFMAAGPIRVVGVVGHVRHWGLAGDDDALLRDEVYYPFAQQPDSLMKLFAGVMSIVVRTSIPPLNAVEPLRREVRGATGDQVLYDVYTMEQLASASLARQRFLLLIFSVFAGVALLLACVGIYGVLAYLTSQRVPEIGVRMALGASGANVIGLVLRQSLRMIFAGAVVGIAAAIAAGQVLQRFVSGVQAADPLTIALMIALLVVAALVASFIPARRASHVDPMSALRQD